MSLGFGFSLPAYNGYAAAFGSGATLALDFTNGNNTLSPLITFSRTTNATVTGSNGLIQNAPMNLLTFSEQFDNAAWTKSNATVTANAVVAPNGTTTADIFVSTATGGASSGASQSVTGSVASYTFSVYAKAGNIGFIRLAMTSNTVAAAAWFNLATGVVGTVESGVTASITAAGNGWYRCSVTRTLAAVSETCFIRLADLDNSLSAPSGSTLSTWGAQLNVGSTATTYNPTTVKNLLGFTENFDNAAWTKSNAFVQTNLLTNSEEFDAAAWNKSSVTVAANTVPAPNGTTTADTLTSSGSSGTVFQPTPSTSGLFTYSVYVRPDTVTTVELQIAQAGNGFKVAFNLTSGTAGAATAVGTGGTVSAMTGAIVPAGGGWYRCSVSYTSGGVGNAFLNVPAAGVVFAWGAQLVQGTSAGDYKATYAAAAAVGYTDIYGQPFAQKLVENTANGAHVMQVNVSGLVSGTSYVASVYAKAGERTKFDILAGAGTGTGSTVFDLVAVTATGGGTITDVGNGWYRCSVTLVPNSGLVQFLLRLYVGASASYAGDGTSGIYIFGAQLSDSASVDPYVYQPVAAPASTAYYGPRFDYDPVTLAPKGLLIEEQRTNLVVQSDGGVGWGTNGTATVTSDTGTAPNGANTAFTLTNATDVVVPTGGNNVFKTFSVSSNTAITISLYVKAITATTVSLNIFDGATGNSSSQAITLTSAWQRVQVTRTSGASTTAMRLTIGDANGTVLCWGAQAEAGAFATSYIPTVASQVTRAADSASMIGNNFARWYTQDIGTLYSDASQMGSAAATYRVFNFAGTNTPNISQFGTASNTGINGVFSIASSAYAVNVYSKTAFAYQISNFAMSKDGATATANTSATVLGTPTIVGIGQNGAGAQFLNGHIKRLAFYPRRLANTELQGITS
jgi:hypothetical protein